MTTATHVVSLRDAVAPLVLTLDIGTSSVRILCFDASARQIMHVEVRQSIEVIARATGAAEIDADGLFATCVDLFDQIGPMIAPRATDVAAVAVATNVW